MNSGATAVGVTCRGISRSFGGTEVLTGIDLSIAPGELLALLGPSGSGKTTLLRLIAGLDRPDSGSITVGTEVVVGEGRFVRPERRNIGMVFQDWALFPHLTVGGNVGFGLPKGHRKRSPRIDRALSQVGMAGFEDRAPHTLSGGQQQRVALARALAPQPRVVLLDEPFSNLDAGLRADVRGEVRRTLRAVGVTGVFVTHDRDEAFTLGDRVAVIRDGQIAQVGAPAEVYAAPVDAWVASFLGDANLLAGTVRARRSPAGDDAAPRVVTGLGQLALRNGSLPDGAGVTVLIRPESLTTTPTPTGRWRITEVEFIGHSTLMRMTDGDITMTCRTLGPPTVETGDRVDVGHRGLSATAWLGPPDQAGRHHAESPNCPGGPSAPDR
ncbi:MAG: ABC transporter ATP-binding protein [Microthrixaceae bacterium]